MAENEEKLRRLRAQIETAAQRDAERIIAEAESKAEEMLAEEEAQINQNLSSAILGKTARFEADERRRLAESRYAADRKVLLHRNALVDGLFDEIQKELADFTRSDKYAAYLKGCADKADKAEKLSPDTVAYVKPADVKTAEKALSGKVAKVEADKGIALGGVIFKYPSKGIYIDLTIDTALENERGVFSAKSEMQL